MRVSGGLGVGGTSGVTPWQKATLVLHATLVRVRWPTLAQGSILFPSPLLSFLQSGVPDTSIQSNRFTATQVTQWVRGGCSRKFAWNPVQTKHANSLCPTPLPCTAAERSSTSVLKRFSHQISKHFELWQGLDLHVSRPSQTRAIA